MDVIFCPECGEKANVLDTACPHCGYPLEKYKNSFRCPECGVDVPTGCSSCPNCGYLITHWDAGLSEEEISFGQHFGTALLQILYSFLYFVAIVHFDLWKKAVIRISMQKRRKYLKVSLIQSDYPLLIWFKRFFFEFLFDALIVISFVGGAFVLTFVRNILSLVIVTPVRWLVSLFSRPAKTIDINHSGSIRQSKA